MLHLDLWEFVDYAQAPSNYEKLHSFLKNTPLKFVKCYYCITLKKNCKKIRSEVVSTVFL